MRICFFGSEIVPTKAGVFINGLSNNVIRLSRGLTKLGHKIHIVTSDVTRTYNGRLDFEFGSIDPVQIHTRYASVAYGMELTINLSKQLLRAQREKKFEVLHAHAGFPGYPIMGLIANLLRTTRLPIVLTLYSAVPRGSLRYAGFSKSIWRRVPPKLLFAGFKKIIAISENVRKSLLFSEVPTEKLAVVPPVVDTEVFFPHGSGFRSEERKQRFTRTILYLGNWNPWKGVDVLIDSMVGVIRRNPRVKLILACGDKTDWYLYRRAPLLKKIAKLGIGSNVVRLGIVENVAELMASSDVVVIPFIDIYSIADSPLTVLEAMACGKPVIATKIGGVPEIIQNNVNGILIDPNDRNALEDAVCRLLSDDEFASKIGTNAASHVRENYDVNLLSKKLERVYEELLA